MRDFRNPGLLTVINYEGQKLYRQQWPSQRKSLSLSKEANTVADGCEQQGILVNQALILYPCFEEFKVAF